MKLVIYGLFTVVAVAHGAVCAPPEIETARKGFRATLHLTLTNVIDITDTISGDVSAVIQPMAITDSSDYSGTCYAYSGQEYSVLTPSGALVPALADDSSKLVLENGVLVQAELGKLVMPTDGLLQWISQTGIERIHTMDNLPFVQVLDLSYQDIPGKKSHFTLLGVGDMQGKRYQIVVKEVNFSVP